ncbi:hypothetical protein [Moraxella equi]|uniref:Kazal-like domain-containing protein n=1 Tax=Moraxella equi TaxID=60442 RepID=A0A378QWN2_9GAMM|nr:hypothetical protein [Moraxella equi]OPH38974.1 hypothetical protein B5J93_04800 [Moraxella equi]STZ04694.1 Uncharacterised protein [Moraxella equi]
MKTQHLILALGMVLSITACSTPSTSSVSTTISQPTHDDTPFNHGMPKLKKPIRHCTMEYMPVCATLEQNGQQFTKTFGNRCSAHTFIDEGVTVVDVRDGDCDPSKQALMRFSR